MVMVVLMCSGCVDFSHKPHHDGVDPELREALVQATRTTLDAYRPDHQTDTATVQRTADRMALWLQTEPELLARVRADRLGGAEIRQEVQLRLAQIRERLPGFQPRGVILWLGEHAERLSPQQELLYAASLVQMSDDGNWRPPEVGVPSR